MRWLAIIGLLALAAGPAATHPMGNFSVSHYMKFRAEGDVLRMTYALDLAEIPTFEMTHRWNLDNPTNADIERLAAQAMHAWVKTLSLEVDGVRSQPSIESVRSSATDGAGGMPVVLVTATLSLPIPSKAVRLKYSDPNFPERTGWKEIVLDRSAKRRATSSIGASKDVSRGLTAYPEDLSFVPPQNASAEIAWDAAMVAAPSGTAHVEPAETSAQITRPPVPAGSIQQGDFLSTLLGRTDMPIHLALAGLAFAFGLGAVHAMSPGHGKTLMAAYLVGSRGTPKHAAFLGALVTFTHTASVFLLGLATLFLSNYFLPEKIVPWMGAISGATIVAVGLSLLRRRIASLRGGTTTSHSHTHSHGVSGHHHHDSEHSHDDGEPHTHHHVPQGEVTLGSLVALGVSGGLVPCPSALVILLSAIAIGRAGYGMLLLIAFSLGLSLVLMAVGMAVLYAKNVIPASADFARGRVARLVPVFSAAVIVCVGVVMTGASIGVFKAPGF